MGDRGLMLIESGTPHRSPANTFQKARGPRLTDRQYDALDSLSFKHGEGAELSLRRLPDGRVFAVFTDPFVMIPGSTRHRYFISTEGSIVDLLPTFTGGRK